MPNSLLSGVDSLNLYLSTTTSSAQKGLMVQSAIRMMPCPPSNVPAQNQPQDLVPIERDELQEVPEDTRRLQVHAFQYRPVLVEPAKLIGGALQLFRRLICLGPPLRHRMDGGQRLERETDDERDASRPGAHGVSPPAERLSRVAIGRSRRQKGGATFQILAETFFRLLRLPTRDRYPRPSLRIL